MKKNPKNISNAWTVKIGEGSRQTLVVDPGVHYHKSDLDQDLGSGPRFMVVDPRVNYQGPLPSPILTVQALCGNLYMANLVCKKWFCFKLK